MAQSFVQVPPDSTGKLVDTFLTAGVHHRQAIVIGDPDTDANVISISSRLRLPIELEIQADFDSGGGSQLVSLLGIALPASGGAIVGGLVASPLFVRLSDGTNAITTLAISAASLPLPTGAATEATLASILAALGSGVVVSGAVTVTGTVTANAGTNLNTSLLALEAGGNLASILSVLGATTGAKVITDANGTIQQYLRGLIYLFITSGQALVTATIAAGTAIIGKVGIDQTTPGTTNAVSIAQIGANTVAQNAGANATGVQRVTVATDDALNAVLGTTAGAAVITDANGTIQQYLRGLVKLAITAGSFLVTVASKTIYQRAIYGTVQTVFNSSTDIAAGAFSAAGTDFTNNDGTIGACLYADAMIEMPDWAAAPVAGTTVQLWGLLINVDGTDDDTDAPSGAASGGARFLGAWVIAAADALQRRTITISLAGIQNGFTPYIFNGTAQNMNNDGGTAMVVKITPWTVAQVG